MKETTVALWCPLSSGGDDPELPDESGGTSSSYPGVSPYAILSEARNMTKDVAGWQNWMYEYDTVTAPSFGSVTGRKSQNNAANISACWAVSAIALVAGGTPLSCPDPRYNYSYELQFGGATKTVVSYSGGASAPKLTAPKSDVSPKPKDELKGYVLAKPTDYIQFRHSIEKGWWAVTAENGAVAPTRSEGEICEITHKTATVADTLASPLAISGVTDADDVSYVRKESDEFHSFRKTYSCVGGEWNTEIKLSNKIPGDTDSTSDSGYAVRAKKENVSGLSVKRGLCHKMLDT
jgi:hypothetical protein